MAADQGDVDSSNECWQLQEMVQLFELLSALGDVGSLSSGWQLSVLWAAPETSSAPSDVGSPGCSLFLTHWVPRIRLPQGLNSLQSRSMVAQRDACSSVQC